MYIHNNITGLKKEKQSYEAKNRLAQATEQTGHSLK